MSSIDFDCKICAATQLEELPEFKALPRVSSDCKPIPPGGRLAVCMACGAVQKPADPNWEQDAAAIYREYQPYFQSGGVEQAVFDPVKGIPRRRSSAILDRLAETRNLGPTGSVLDVGCGNGVLLSAFAEIRPQWQLFGHELSALNLGKLETIPGFKQLFTGGLTDIPRKFDVVTMMHSLEHFPEPLAGLKDLQPKLVDDGCLFIEVPNAEATPFDLLIADHASHFTRHDIARLVKRAGMGASVIATDWITKELSVVMSSAGPIVTLPQPLTPADVLKRVKAQLAWLQAIVDGAKAASKKGRFGIFGTSIAAMWLFGQVADKVDFFVDEDPSRKQATLFDRPIMAPGDAPKESYIYVALIPQVARAVANRLGRPGVHFEVPPLVG